MQNHPVSPTSALRCANKSETVVRVVEKMVQKEAKGLALHGLTDRQIGLPICNHQTLKQFSLRTWDDSVHDEIGLLKGDIGSNRNPPETGWGRVLQLDKHFRDKKMRLDAETEAM